MRSIRGWGSLFQENQRISEQIVELKGQMQELEALERENVELRKQLKICSTLGSAFDSGRGGFA